MIRSIVQLLILVVLLTSGLALAGCESDADLYVPDLLAQAKDYNGKEVVVDGAYLGRPGSAVLALGVSTLDNGLDAQPLGDTIWLESFPETVANTLHRPGDAIYGFVRVKGMFDSAGGYGANNAYQYRLRVTSAEPIEHVKRTEVRVPASPLGEGKVSFFELLNDKARYNEQTITTRGYYFWNGAINVLAEGIATEEDGSSPMPIGKIIWMEGFPPGESGKLHLGPNNSFVWGLVEVTGQFKSGQGFGKDGAYQEFIQATSATALENAQEQK